MATAADLASGVLRHLGVLGAEEDPIAYDIAAVLGALKIMLDAWRLDPRAVTGYQELSYTPTAGVQSFTIGPSGNVVATQPLRIELNSYYRLNGVDSPLLVGSVDEYNAKAGKDTRGAPSLVALNRGSDTATVYMYPAADGVSQLRLVVLKEPLASFESITASTTLTLPAGMRAALEWCIADDLTADYKISRADVLGKIRDKAREYRRLFKRGNTRVGSLAMPYGVSSMSTFNINEG